jgi:protein-S-isoprenylcysteine O-methyltransferase Ste14
MTATGDPQLSREQQDTDGILRIGRWMFAQRTWLSAPLALALLLVHVGEAPRSLAVALAGVLIVGAGEALRLWAVRHIGVISRTRSDRLGPLVTSGPFGIVRNPLYLGNVLLWVGFAVSARLLWMAPFIVAVLGFEYHAIVRWEEQLLESRRGEQYRSYAARVPRWWPSWSAPAVAPPPAPPYSWRHTLFSERGTLVAIGVGYLVLWIRSAIGGI